MKSFLSRLFLSKCLLIALACQIGCAKQTEHRQGLTICPLSVSKHGLTGDPKFGPFLAFYSDLK